MKIIRIIPFITTVMIMVLIFGFSSQNSETSSNLSRGITETVVNSLPIIKDMTEAQKKTIILNIHNFVRKGAHFTLYAILGFSAAAMFLSARPQKRMLYIWIYAVVLSCVYASTDEFHQLFVSGRGGKVSDVILDTSGSMAGSGLFILARRVFFKIKDFLADKA